MKRVLMAVAAWVVWAPVVGWAADETKMATEVVELIRQKQLDAAADKLDQALRAFPDSPSLNVQRSVLAKRLDEAGRPADAARQIEALLDYALRVAANQPRMRPILFKYLFQLRALGQKAKQPDAVERKIDALIQMAASLPNHGILQGLLRAQKAMVLAEHGKSKEALALADQLVAQAKAEHEAAPEDVSALVRLINMQKTRIDVLNSFRLDQARTAQQELLELLAEQAPKHKSEPDVVKAYVFESVAQAARLSRDHPEQADTVIAKLKQYIEGLNRNDPGIRSDLARAERGLKAVQSRINTARQQRALIGTPAVFPENVVAWIGGDALASDDLKGKVVVLDFWAVWSGPCIQAFSHLRRWHEQYAGQGLVIIGATRYFHFDWDDQQHRIRFVSDLSPEKEKEALKRFAQHHQLPYRLAVFTDTSLMKHYAVKAIPQTVVIDRRGIVRMIRTGSGQQAMQELEAMIQQCLSESLAN